MRHVGRLGVWYPVDRLNGAGIRRLLRTVEDLGYSTLWARKAGAVPYNVTPDHTREARAALAARWTRLPRAASPGESRIAI